ncbi:hypothetical protein SprV_0301144000 [Sparganum proliferum]
MGRTLPGVLNRPSTISDAVIAYLPQVETNVDLVLPPSLKKTIGAVQQLSSGKAPGSDAMPAEIFARILINRLNNHLEQGLLPESQCGFRRHRGTTDMIFAARQLQEKCQEMRTHLYSTFVDLTKAFDTVNREGLWKIMQKFGCPERFIEMVRQLHDGMMARVTDNGAVSEAFAVTNGVKQGCVLAPTLFSLMFSAMLMDAYRDERPGIRIAYRTDGQLLNQRRLQFQSRVSTTMVHELLFADDCALNTTSEEDTQRSMDLFSAACENFGLVINTQKTVVMHQPPPPNTATPPNAPPPQISVNGTQLQVEENFPYLSSALSRSTKIDGEVARRISKASQSFGRLQSTVLNRHGLYAQSIVFLLLLLLSYASPSSTSSSSSSSSSSSFRTSSAPTTAALAAVAHANTAHIPDTTTDTTPTPSDSRGEDQDYTCSHCDRTFTSHIGLVSHLRIHRTETGEPVPGAPTYTHRTRLHCPHCPLTFTHRMGLFGHMRTHESGIDRSPETPTTPTMPSPILISLPCVPIATTTTTTTSVADADTDTADYSCPHRDRTFTSRIGLVGHL